MRAEWRAAVVVTAEEVGEPTSEITHTAKDRPEIVDCGILVEAARALYDLLRKVEGMVGATFRSSSRDDFK